MDRQEIEATITKLLLEAVEVEPARVEPRTPFAGLLESIEVAALVADVEDEYDVTLDQGELASVNTIRELARLVEKTAKAKD